MDRKGIAAMLRRAGVPVCHRGWPDGSEPEYPYIAYSYAGNDGSLSADNRIFGKASRWSASLFTEKKDDMLEESLEDAFDAADVPYRKRDASPEGGDYCEVVYQFTTY